MATTAQTTAASRVDNAAKPERATRRVPFAELVRVHHRWRDAMREGSGVCEEQRAVIDDE